MRRLVREQVNWSIVLAQSLTRARAVLIRAGYAEDEATKLVTDAADRGMDPEKYAAKLARKVSSRRVGRSGTR
jgi:hypothetical protein